MTTHFHNEAQITFVLKGQRSFHLRGEMSTLGAGQGLFIPAHAPHKALPGSADLSTFNAYLPAGDYAVSELIEGIRARWIAARQFRPETQNPFWEELAALISTHRRDAGKAPPRTRQPTASGERELISQVARRMGMSREGFSRTFAKRYGMPPHAFQVANRLNRARDLLREGEGISAAAAETGFADQSHLGRCFRLAFGITPGRYRIG